MTLTLKQAEKMMRKNSGNLYLNGCTSLKSLPENLAVGNSIDLSDCTSLKSLPDNLAVGGWLYLRGCTSLESLPDNLAVGGWLYLGGCTSLESLPDNLTVGGSLYLGGCTSLESLPDNLTVGENLYLGGCTSLESPKIKKLKDGDYVPGRYLYADGILTHVKRRKAVNGITYYQGKIPNRNVVYDGKNYAHCKDFRTGIADLIFKSAEERGAGQYRQDPLDKPFTVPELTTRYRVITGACQQGTQAFIDSFGDQIKERYTIREVIELTKGQYGAGRFAEFYGNDEEA